MNDAAPIRTQMIALQIRTARREQGLSQQAFADAVVQAAADEGDELTLTRVAVSQWEGAYFEPALRYRRYVAKVLDADLRVMFPNVGRNDAHALIRRGEFPVPVRKVGSSYKVSRHLLEQWCNDQDAAAS